MIFQRSLIRYLFRRYLFLFSHPFLAFISPFLISFSLECRDAGQLRFPQFNFNLCPLSEERFNYWGGNGNNTECYLRLFSSHAQMLYDFFSSVGQSPSMRDAYSKFAISFRSDNEETFVWKRVQFVWKYFSETFFLVLRLMRI